ncbi:MAG: hypothetical protein GDA36_10660 [Rhodobacteraceae bacterium]|nr:hypothetical protein [Paracoccaceae bacterium]
MSRAQLTRLATQPRLVQKSLTEPTDFLDTVVAGKHTVSHFKIPGQTFAARHSSLRARR